METRVRRGSPIRPVPDGCPALVLTGTRRGADPVPLYGLREGHAPVVPAACLPRTTFTAAVIARLLPGRHALPPSMGASAASADAEATDGIGQHQRRCPALAAELDGAARVAWKDVHALPDNHSDATGLPVVLEDKAQRHLGRMFVSGWARGFDGAGGALQARPMAPMRLSWYLLLAGALAAWFLSTAHGEVGRTVPPLDDAFLHFQYAASLAAGHPFQHVRDEACTSGAESFLWPVLIAPAAALGAHGQGLYAWSILIPTSVLAKHNPRFPAVSETPAGVLVVLLAAAGAAAYGASKCASAGWDRAGGCSRPCWCRRPSWR